jgi:hypothetical protein
MIAIVLPRARIHSAISFSQRLRDAVEETRLDGGPVAVSFGISASHGAMIDFNEMLDTASFVLKAQTAAGEVAEIARPRSFYCHFLSSPAFAAVDIEVSLLKRGSRAESLSVAMSQSGKPILQALVKTATDGPGYAHQHPSMPDVPPAEEVESYEYVPAPGRPTFLENPD